MSSLQVQNLSKSFGRVRALHNVNFDVNDGEFMVLLGPTAAGKTTTLRCVAGLEKLDQGTISMDGQVINALSPAERDVAFVFQSYALYPRKTAYENMAFPLRARDMSAEAIDKRVRAVADLLQISELLNRRPAAMSGGQQQRVALGRAMVRQPRIFLMDEPLTNLDFKLRVEMRAELKRLQREVATTFFYVTNDQVEAMSMADRIAVLNQSVLQQIDAPEQIYDHPVNLFVAQFVGSPRMNTLPCHYDAAQRLIVGDDSTWSVQLSARQLDILNRAPIAPKLICGIRAEDIQLGTTGAIEGQVYIVEPLGDKTFVDVALGNQTIKVRASPDFVAQSGDPIWLTFDTDRMHIFDAVTEMTIF
jgi:multiple sugar transport system ATP-binding protein